MTRTEQERVVMQYLNGDLTPEAEQEFFIQVATDDDLRQTLNAFRVVETALRKHRDAAATQHSTTRAHVLGALGMTPTSSAVESSSSRWLIVGASLCSIILGTFVLAPLLGTSNPDPSTPRTTNTSASTPVRQEPSAIQLLAPSTSPSNVSPVDQTGQPTVRITSRSLAKKRLSRSYEPSISADPTSRTNDTLNSSQMSATPSTSNVVPSSLNVTPSTSNVVPTSTNVTPTSMHTDRSSVDTVLIRVKMDANPD